MMINNSFREWGGNEFLFMRRYCAYVYVEKAKIEILLSAVMEGIPIKKHMVSIFFIQILQLIEVL